MHLGKHVKLPHFYNFFVWDMRYLFEEETADGYFRFWRLYITTRNSDFRVVHNVDWILILSVFEGNVHILAFPVSVRVI